MYWPPKDYVFCFYSNSAPSFFSTFTHVWHIFVFISMLIIFHSFLLYLLLYLLLLLYIFFIVIFSLWHQAAVYFSFCYLNRKYILECETFLLMKRFAPGLFGPMCWKFTFSKGDAQLNKTILQLLIIISLKEQKQET